MFRIEFFVEDKNLAKVLTGVDGLIYNLAVQPVRNAETDHKGAVRAAGGPESAAGFLRELIAERAKAGKLHLTSSEVRQLADAQGLSVKATYQALKIQHDRGWLKRVDKGQYEILPHNTG